MDFNLTTEQEILRATVREFAQREIAPHSLDWDERQYFPLELFPRLGELGLTGVLFPEEYGGAGLGYAELAIVVEEVSRVDGGIGLSVAAHNALSANHLFCFGTQEQKRKYLEPLVRGAQVGAWALTEPQAGSDTASLQTRARKTGDRWVIRGSKSFITHASYAGVYIVMASTDPEQRSRGVTAFIVERGTAGLTPGRKENKLGCRASDTASLILEDCAVGPEQMLGELGRGLTNALELLSGGRISIAAMAVGIAQGALDSAVRYAREREQFGKPLAEFQGIQFKLADMESRTQAARWLTYRAACLRDQGKPARLESSIAKYYASETAVWVAEQAVQIHGAYGYTKDYPPEKFWRDAKVCTIGEGTSEIQKIVIARELLRS